MASNHLCHVRFTVMLSVVNLSMPSSKVTWVIVTFGTKMEEPVRLPKVSSSQRRLLNAVSCSVNQVFAVGFPRNLSSWTS